MLRKLLFLTCVTGFFYLIGAAVPSAMAQTGTIEGTITSQVSGQTLIGANVYIPNIQRGSATDSKGHFAIENLPYGTYQLRVSYIGYVTKTVEVTVDQGTVTVNVGLKKKVSQLGQMVVTALGVEKNINKLSYSAQKLDAESIVQSGGADLLQSLSGKVSGLRVSGRNGMGASTDLILRGINSISGNNQPLFVVDGVPYANNRFNTNGAQAGFRGYDYGNTALDIDPANIASITVLKGAAATALYGSRAANGAVIITTKQGAPTGETTTISFNSSVGFQFIDPSTFPKYQEKYGAGYSASFLHIDKTWTQAPNDSVLSARYPADASFGPRFDPNKKVYQWRSWYPDSPYYHQALPWVPAKHHSIEFFNVGTTFQNSLFIRGGINDKTGYYKIGYSQDNITGVMPNAKLKKYKLNFATGYSINDKLQVEASINYSRNDGRGRPAQGYNTIMTSFRQWYETNVDILQQKRAYFRHRKNVTWNLNPIRKGAYFWGNPYFIRYENFETDSRNRYTGYAQVTYDALDWLTFRGRMSIDTYHNLIEERKNIGSTGDSYYRRRTNYYQAKNFRIDAIFKKQLSNNFAFNGRLGTLISRTHRTGISASTNGGLVTRGLYSLDNSKNSILYPGETDITTGLNAIYASANFSYNNLLFLTATGRTDKSSTLPENQNRYFYPSVSASMNFSQLIDAKWLSFGKIRGSWAKVGSPAQPLSLRDVYLRGINFGSARQFALPATKNNSNLKPEITKSWEVGLQLGFLNHRVYVTATYYNGSTINQILRAQVSNATGYQSKWLNAGQIDNNGIELSLQTRLVSAKHFSWNLGAHWSKNNSKVVSLTPTLKYYQMVAPQGGVSIGAHVGEPIGVIRGSAFVRDKNGNPIVAPATIIKDKNGNVINKYNYYYKTKSKEKIGNMLPDWTGGVSTQFHYRNWSFHALVDVKWGGDIFSLDQYYGAGTGVYPYSVGLNKLGNPKRAPVYTRDSDGDITGLQPKDVRGGWVRPGVLPSGNSNTKLAPYNSSSIGYANTPNEAYVYDASYIKLREVGISYSLPSTILQSTKVLDKVSFSVIGRNLWIIYKNLPYADPEASLSAGNLSGYSGGMMPAIRSVSFNVKLNF